MSRRNGSALIDVVAGFLVVGIGLVPSLTLISSNAAAVRPRANHAMVAILAADLLDRLATSGPSLPPAGGTLSGDALRAAAVEALGEVPGVLERDIAAGALSLSIERRVLSGAEDGSPAGERVVAWILTVRWTHRTDAGRARRFFRVTRETGVSR